MPFSAILHNIAGIIGPKMSYTESLVALTDQQWQLLICGGVYQSASENYWPVMSLTNPRYHLRGCQLLIRGKKSQNRPRKGPKPNILNSFLISNVYLCKMTQLFTRKKSHFTIPLLYTINIFLLLYYS